MDVEDLRHGVQCRTGRRWQGCVPATAPAGLGHGRRQAIAVKALRIERRHQVDADRRAGDRDRVDRILRMFEEIILCFCEVYLK